LDGSKLFWTDHTIAPSELLLPSVKQAAQKG
jgi:hypothetical protein